MATPIFDYIDENHHDGIEPFWAEDMVCEEDPEGDPPEPATPPEPADVSGLRSAVMAERKKRQEYEKELADLRAAQAAKEQADAEKRGEFEKLYKDTSGEVESLRERVSAYETKETARLERVTARNAEALEKLPEQYRGLVPEGLDPDAASVQIERIKAIADTGKPPVGARAGGGKVPAEQIPAECIAEATKHGKDPEWWFTKMWKPRNSP